MALFWFSRLVFSIVQRGFIWIILYTVSMDLYNGVDDQGNSRWPLFFDECVLNPNKNQAWWESERVC